MRFSLSHLLLAGVALLAVPALASCGDRTDRIGGPTNTTPPPADFEPANSEDPCSRPRPNSGATAGLPSSELCP